MPWQPFSMQALYAESQCRMTLLSDRLTFHFVEGDSVVKHPGNQVSSRCLPEREVSLLACFTQPRAVPTICSSPILSVWQRARNDKIFTGLYTAWNCAQFARNRRDVLAVHPEYSQCWFSQQAEWNVYSYQCAATIDHLPHEFKLLWHGNTSALDSVHSRSNCNLPSVCNRCRGKDGRLRPVALLSSSLPCGFCRCDTDLDNPPYITLPPLSRASH